MRNAKRVALLMGAMVLICIISVVGTLAYLQANTSELKNVFVAGGDGKLFENKPESGMTLVEHTVELNATTGEYQLKTGATDITTTGIDSYKAVPNATLPKDPYLKGVDKTDVTAYLYLEVIDTTDGVITYTLTDDWQPLMDGANQVKHNNNPIYVYKTTGTTTSGTIVSADFNVQILKDNQVKVVNDNAKVEGLDTDGKENKLSFAGYICQTVSFDDATDAFKKVFNA